MSAGNYALPPIISQPTPDPIADAQTLSGTPVWSPLAAGADPIMIPAPPASSSSSHDLLVVALLLVVAWWVWR